MKPMLIVLACATTGVIDYAMLSVFGVTLWTFLAATVMVPVAVNAVLYLGLVLNAR